MITRRVLAFAAVLATLSMPLPAQGPGPVALRNPIAAIPVEPHAAGDSSRATHWQDGAAIGALSGGGFYMLLALTFGAGCRGSCDIGPRGLIVTTAVFGFFGGAIGALVPKR